MKRILVLIVFFISSLFVLSQQVNFPQYEFKSTSSYQCEPVQRTYIVPVAAYDIQSPNTYNVPRKIVVNDERPGFNPSDPGWENTPAGDPVIPLLIISFVYCLYIKLNKKLII